MSSVLITGISGYLAAHIANELLKCGHKVRGTVRNLKDENKVKPIRDLAANAKYPIELVEADLLDESCWKSIVKDVDVVFHAASPLPLPTDVIEDEQVVIKPAVDGTLNVLKACLDTNVKRVVLTSSGLAITGSPYKNDRVYDENDWGDSNTNFAYCKSKILAEKAAWDFVKQRKANNQNCFELTVINPTFILGPVLHNTVGMSSFRFLNILKGQSEKVPELYLPTCDVRDVARAQVKAAFLPEAAGERIAIISERNFIPMKRWAEILNEEFSKKGFKIPLEEELGNGLGKTTSYNDHKMRNLLDITPTDFKKTVIDMAYSLIERGYLDKN